MPSFYGFGSTLFNNNKYRFIVIEKFDKDLEAFLKTISKKLLLGAVINIVRQIVIINFLNIFIYILLSFTIFLMNQCNILFPFVDRCIRVYS